MLRQPDGNGNWLLRPREVALGSRRIRTGQHAAAAQQCFTLAPSSRVATTNPDWQLTTPGKKMLRQPTGEERPGAGCAKFARSVRFPTSLEEDDPAQRKGRSTGSGGAAPDRVRSDGADHRLAADGGKRRSHPARRAGELSRLSDSGAASVRALLGIWGRWSQFDNLQCGLAESIRRRSA